MPSICEKLICQPNVLAIGYLESAAGSLKSLAEGITASSAVNHLITDCTACQSHIRASTNSTPISGKGYQPIRLHRSKPVYQCKVSNPFAAVGNPSSYPLSLSSLPRFGQLFGYQERQLFHRHKEAAPFGVRDSDPSCHLARAEKAQSTGLAVSPDFKGRCKTYISPCLIGVKVNN